MLPAPAMIAAAPTAKSRPSCNPAVPPPPVTGAALGILLSVGVGVGVTVTVAVAVAVWGAGLVVATPGVPADVVPPEPGDVVVPEPGDVVLPEAGAVPEPVTVAVKVGTVGVEEEAPLHADTAASGAIRVRALQQRAVSLAPSAVPAIVTRTFMKPSSSARQMTTVFPVPASDIRLGREKPRPIWSPPAQRRAGPRKRQQL
jgi:hypothetical protein